MVKLHIKKGEESHFLYETTVDIIVEELLVSLIAIYNGRLKVQRICTEVEELADHGITMSPHMQGLADDQIEELKLTDDYSEQCQPSGGCIINIDDIGRRNGKAPIERMADVLKKTVKEAKDLISKKNVEAEICMTQLQVNQALQLLQGAVMIVYPMGLPPYDPVRCEFENVEDLSGTQAALEVIELENSSLWWAGKELTREKKLSDFIGKNEKTKVICKLQKKGQGAPARESIVNENEQKAMMAYYYRKQEELKALDVSGSDDSYLNNEWADSQNLKRQFQGLGSIRYDTVNKP